MSGRERGERRGVTRRGLLKGAGAAAAAGVIARPAAALAQHADDGVEIAGPGPVHLVLRVNGAAREVEVEPRRTLLDALRGDLDLTGAKRVCDRGTCGACTIWLDGAPAYACSVLAIEAVGSEITTIEGLGTPAAPHPMQAAFARRDALQCGFCTPGFVMACAWAAETHGAALDDATLRRSVCGNLCRCGTYPHVVQAALEGAREMTAARDSGAGDGAKGGR